MSPPERESRPGGYSETASQTHPRQRDQVHIQSNGYRRQATESQQVSWWEVHEFVGAVLNQVNGWPTLGTPAWCSLTHDDPRKWAALLDGAQHWALRLDTCQEARAETSRDISAAADWPQVARNIQQHNDFYAEKPWLRRVAS
jgi:hypothetical protein